jgi:hypothetical protein
VVAVAVIETTTPVVAVVALAMVAQYMDSVAAAVADVHKEATSRLAFSVSCAGRKGTSSFAASRGSMPLTLGHPRSQHHLL